MHIQMVARSPKNACFCLLVDIVKNWIQDMAEKFPRNAAGLPNAHLAFDREKEQKMGAFIDDIMKEYESSGIPATEMSSLGFGRLGVFIHLALFHAWSDEVCNNEKPPIEFPTNCLVGRYASSVVYYLARWTLYSAPKALIIAIVKRPLYFMFAALHTIDEHSAKALNLPTSLVERQKQRALVYCTLKYFDFICLVESIYLANLTLKMMLAYNDCNIANVIKMSTLLHKTTMDSFSCLSSSKNYDDNTLLLTHIIERYSHMREPYFVKHLKANSGNQLQKLVDCQATRTKVAHAVVYAKKEKVVSDDNIIVIDDTPVAGTLGDGCG
jgi:hypothetical protein